MKLEAPWFSDALGETVTETQIAQMRRLDDAGSMPLLEALAHRAAEKQIRREDWTSPSAAT